jgi:uncharacterized membrane protein YjjP (DUF1212 family)
MKTVRDVTLLMSYSKILVSPVPLVPQWKDIIVITPMKTTQNVNNVTTNVQLVKLLQIIVSHVSNQEKDHQNAHAQLEPLMMV